MAEDFDPYHEWLGISSKDQPPTHYRLLGLDPFEPSSSVIETAADQRMAHLRTFQTGKNSALSQELLNEVATAKLCLLNPEKKKTYDQWLRGQMTGPAVETPRSDSGLDSTLAALLQADEVAAANRPPRPKPSAKPRSRNMPMIVGAVAVVGVLLVGLAIWALTRPSNSGETVQAKRSSEAPSDDAAEKERQKSKTADKTDKETPAKSAISDETTVTHQATTPAKPVDAAETPPKPEVTAKPESETTMSETANAPSPAKPSANNEPAAEEKPAATDEPAAKDVPPAKEETAAKDKSINGAKPEEAVASQATKGSPRQAIPAAAVQQGIVAQVSEVYKPEEARKPSEQGKLANDLMELAEKSAKSEERFVLLRMAAELACKAGDATLMFQAIDRLCGQFDVDALGAKTKMLARLAAGATDTARIKAVVDNSSTLIDQAVNAEQFDVAMELAVSACLACQKAQGASMRKQAVDRRKEIERLQSLSKEVDEAREAARTNPADPDANLTLGQWYCFTLRDWAKGLPHLAKGGDESLKKLAAKELASPPNDPMQQMELADGWWNQSQEAKGKARIAIQLHAGAWYRQAQPNLPEGLLKVKVDKRLGELATSGQETPELPGHPMVPVVVPFDEKTAKRHQLRWAKHLQMPVVQTNSVGMKLVLIPPGEFQMGSSSELVNRELAGRKLDGKFAERLTHESPHRVRITKPFWLSATEVTQAEYQRVMGSNPSKFTGDTSRPVENVTWQEAVDFCKKLSEMPQEKAARRTYRLPREAEWEFACRAGNAGCWSFSLRPDAKAPAMVEALLNEYGWSKANGGGKTHSVGQRRPNVWGLFDMYGNVWEWCEDWYDQDFYKQSAVDDPVGPSSGSSRVHRGGSIHDSSGVCRSAARSSDGPDGRFDSLGIRVTAVLAE